MLEAALGLSWLIVLVPVLAFALIGLFLHRWPRAVAATSIAAILFSLSLAGLVAVRVLSEEPGFVYKVVFPWLNMPGLRVDMGIMVDGLSAVMLLVVTMVAFLVQVYSLGYMRDDPGFASYFAYQSLFAGAMLGLVLSSNFGQIYVFWELVGLASYLLIGFWFGKVSAKEAAKKAFITNRVGDFGFLLGILFLQILFGTLDFQGLSQEIAGYTSTAALITVSLLLFAGPVGKSAQFPLHVWLPDAMEGPTPVSALIHAATMVAAGVYLVARAFFIFSVVPETMAVIAGVGGFTALFAATIAVAQNDIKRILAYSTLSQLGYMIMAMGIGAMTAGMFHLMTHAFFKGLLFLAAGSVIHGLSGEQNIWNMGRLSRKMPLTTWTFVVGALALAGIPPLSGFWSKDEILLSAWSGGYVGLYFLGTAVAFLTAFYMFRLVFVVFFGSREAKGHAHESGPVMTLPLVLLALLSIGSGFLGMPGAGNLFAHWVTYPGSTHPEPSFAVMTVSTLVALLGIALAWAVYQKGLISPDRVKRTVPGLYRLLVNKYYVDELYLWLTRRLVDGTGKLMFWFDIYIVNGLVNGIGYLTERGGQVLSYTETGQVQTYAGYMLVGALILLAGLAALWG